MTTRERFERFFSAVNDGHGAYRWQGRLVELVAREGRWPTGIAMPTGAGKSSVVDVHVFLVAERERLRTAKKQVRRAAVARPPRRLVLVAPRRALVDDQFEHARRLADTLRAAVSNPDDHGRAVVDVARSLAALRSAEDGASLDASPLCVTRMRGGVRLDLDWRLDPGQCQVICATPQMWGSRLLLRGFQATRRSRDLEAGLLGHDVAVVIDEAHLHERLIETARRVARVDDDSLGLQVVAMSATRAEDDALRMDDDDRSDEKLCERVEANKQVAVTSVDNWRRDAAGELAKQAQSLAGEGTVGVFVNTVAMALDVAGRLEGAVEIVCGRMRPADVARLRAARPGLLDSKGNLEVDFLVSTQSLEVGVDLDLPAIVTTIAPAGALAQRAGRLNRSGERTRSRLVVLAPRNLADAPAAELDKLFAPYSGDDILAAMRWIDTLAGDVSPQRVSETPLPTHRRPVLPPLTRVELETFALADQDLSADADVAFYVEEPRDKAESEIWIGARRYLDWPEHQVRAMLRAAPPRPHELASFPLGSQLDAVLEAGRNCWVIRDENGRASAEPLGLLRERDDPLKPRDVVLVAHGSPVCTRGVIGLVGRKAGEPLNSVMADRPDGEPDMIEVLEATEVQPALELDPTLGSRRARSELARVLAAAGKRAAATALRRRLNELEVTWCEEGSECERGLLVLSPTVSEGRLPATAVSESSITIDDHCAAVESRLDAIIARQGVDVPVALGVGRGQLLAAARWHDAGKHHPRFQQRMGAKPGDPPLAKPAPGYRPDRGRRGDGWRHEPLSAAYIWARCGRDPVSTLVGGAHHGHGLPLFNRGRDAILDGWDGCEPDVREAVSELFGGCGRYELERARLIAALGLHRLAFLEALLRCADMQVSREGR
jgi:CRISPR-associated endonuclease/helicase Cas3